MNNIKMIADVAYAEAIIRLILSRSRINKITVIDIRIAPCCETLKALYLLYIS
jgi:hypothetical protein